MNIEKDKNIAILIDLPRSTSSNDSIDTILPSAGDKKIIVITNHISYGISKKITYY